MFYSARLKLTIWYLLVIMVISVTLSMVIYKVQASEIERIERLQQIRIERGLRGRFVPPFSIANPQLLEETKKRLLLILIFVNAGIFVISGGLGYFLAGRTLRPIKEMVDEQNRFITDVSHELRTPLTSLKSAFEVYLRNSRPTLRKAKTLVTESIDEVNKLQSLSESLLQLTQYQKPNGHSEFGKLSLTQVINEAVRKVEPIAKQKEITIQSNLTDLDIEGNKYSLIDLTIILLDNAIKYSPAGSKVVVRTEKTDSSALISVKDQGIGIGDKDLPHIFDRFFRADSARSKSAANGYGLGLSIAKKIIDIHRGSIAVDSKLGNGSTFSIQLPIRQSPHLEKPPFFS